MLTKTSGLKGYSMHCIDGKIGKIKDFLIDDRFWVIRHMVADTGNWLKGRQVLISPHALVSVNKEEQYITVNLSKKQIMNSPPLASDQPVSRQFEEEYYGYYGWPQYWEASEAWDAYPTVIPETDKKRETNRGGKPWNHHLHSIRALRGYHIQAADDEIGHIDDFVVDDETWTIRYLIIDTRNWWPGKKVLISPQWIERVSWSESKVYVGLRRENIRRAPEYSDDFHLNRDYEAELHRHYKRPAYWEDEPADKEHS